jgi:hypothetical protein
MHGFCASFSKNHKLIYYPLKESESKEMDGTLFPLTRNKTDVDIRL